MHTDAARNGEATRRLRELVAMLSPADLAAPLGGGWTVAMALGHLAFWDARQRGAIQYFIDTGVLIGDELPPPHNPDLTNPALEPVLALVDRDGVRELVIEAAQAIDELVADLDESAMASILESEHAYVVRRWAHREEHIAQIQEAIAPRA